MLGYLRSGALTLVSTASVVTATAALAAQTEPPTRYNYWTLGTPLPGKLEDSAAGTIGKLIYVAGGVKGAGSSYKSITGQTLIFNPATKTYASGASIPTPVAGAAYAVLENKLYLFGGIDRKGNYLNTVVFYNPATDQWSRGAPMPTARQDAAATVIGSTAYVAGGNASNTDLRLQAFEAYDAVHDSWTQLPPMPTGRSEPSAGAANGIVVVAGGYTTSAETGVTEGYNVAANSWSTLATQPTPVSFACTQQIGSLLYVLNGTQQDKPLTVSQVYDIAADTWTVLASGRKAAGGAAGALSSASGPIECFGGTEDLVVGGKLTRTTQIYHP